MKKIRRCLLLLQLLALFANVWAQNTPAPNKLIEFVLTPNAKDWNYKVNEQTSIQVSVLKFGVPMDDVSVSYETGPEMLPADKKGTAVFKNGQGKIEIGTSKQPGFRQLLVKTEYKGRTYSDMIKVAYAPDKIEPTVPMPNDFIQYWENAKEEAARCLTLK